MPARLDKGTLAPMTDQRPELRLITGGKPFPPHHPLRLMLRAELTLVWRRDGQAAAQQRGDERERA